MDLGFSVDGKHYSQERVGDSLPNPPKTTSLLAFTTSGMFSIGTGEKAGIEYFDGPEGADAICQQAAQDAALRGDDWHAILSLSGDLDFSIDSDVKAARADVLVTNVKFLSEGYAIFKYDEKGNELSKEAKAWTGRGTQPDGSTVTCDGWRNPDAAGSYGQAAIPSPGVDWSSINHESCDERLHLYCILLKH